MRLWSMHPRYLDRQALTACWREGLLAQSVISDPTRGYTHHPQLQRFRATADPLAAVGTYLAAIVDEADARGYRFAREKIRTTGFDGTMSVHEGQLSYEWQHLLGKLQRRSPELWERWRAAPLPDPHPLFTVVDGPVEDWERIA